MAQVWYPVICNYDIAPTEYKKWVANKLRSSRNRFTEDPYILRFYDTQIANLENDVCNFENRQHFQKAFVKYNDRQDQFRSKKTWRQLVPQLELALTQQDL